MDVTKTMYDELTYEDKMVIQVVVIFIAQRDNTTNVEYIHKYGRWYVQYKVDGELTSEIVPYKLMFSEYEKAVSIEVARVKKSKYRLS